MRNVTGRTRQGSNFIRSFVSRVLCQSWRFQDLLDGTHFLFAFFFSLSLPSTEKVDGACESIPMWCVHDVDVELVMNQMWMCNSPWQRNRRLHAAKCCKCCVAFQRQKSSLASPQTLRRESTPPFYPTPFPLFFLPSLHSLFSNPVALYSKSHGR